MSLQAKRNDDCRLGDWTNSRLDEAWGSAVFSYQLSSYWTKHALVAIALALSLTSTLLAVVVPQEEQVDFERHIAPILGQLGCNSAACHGAFNGGKGGLQLSLFGHSAEMDFEALKDRINQESSELSLLLQKPSGREEHEGGVKFQPNSDTYKRLKQWIEHGARWSKGSGRVKRLVVNPERVVLTESLESQNLTITAEFSDGSHEIVTHLSQFTSRDEGIAMVDNNGRVIRSQCGDTSIIVAYGNSFASVIVLVPFPPQNSQHVNEQDAAASLIDSRIDEKLNLLHILPSPLATDEEFLRRVTIDTIGTIPTPEEVTQFCSCSDLDKREKKIDELLCHPMHAALWATRMCDITKCDVAVMGEDEVTSARRAQMWHDWFRTRFARNTSYDSIVRGIVMATSREGKEINEWLKHEEQLVHSSRENFSNDYAQRESLDLFWRRQFTDNDARLKANAELIATAFTGVRLNCAQCHKHPFDRWTQDNYAAFANIFANVIYGSSDETNSAVMNELTRRGQAKLEGEAVRPLPRIREVFVSEELGRTLSGSSSASDVAPRAFDGPKFKSSIDQRSQFFAWLVEPENPYFARSFVNRVWASYFGIGIVDPVDDFSITNPPSHPELLDDLAQQFCASGFDIRALEKQILLSEAYQRSSAPNECNRDDRRNFARQYLRPMLAEVALDVLNKTLGVREDFGDFAPQGALAIEVGTNRVPGQAGNALEVLGRGKRESTCDCDRRTESDLRQFIFFANSPSIIEKIKRGSIRELLSQDDHEVVSQLYLRFLSRKPNAREIEFAVAHLKNSPTREGAFDDLVWALVNSREFITNH